MEEELFLKFESMNFLTQRKDSKLSRLAYIGFAFVMAVFYDVFFWDKEFGIGVFIFALLYAAGFLLLGLAFSHIRSYKNIFLLFPFFLFALESALYKNSFVQFFSPIFVFILGIIFSLLITLDNPFKHKFAFLQIPLVRNIFSLFSKYKLMFRDLIPSKDGDNAVIKKIGIGVIIALPLLLLFSAFFVDADAIFAQKLKEFFDFEHSLGWRIVRTILGTLLFGAFFYVVIDKEHTLTYQEKNIAKFDSVIVGTILTLINILFLAFVSIQISYLFAGKTFVFENDITSADYARSGFFELLGVILLSALIMLIVYRSYSAHKLPKFITFLQVFLMVQVGIIAASALKRMNIYQIDYGYTVLRLYVEWFIYFTLFILLVSVVSLIGRITFWRFFYMSILTGLAALVLVSFINVDSIIAKENIHRFVEEEKTLDVSYFKKLSLDAFPDMILLLDEKNIERLNVADILLFQDIIKNAEQQVEKHDSFFEWNRSVSRVRELLNNDVDKKFVPLFEKAQRQDLVFTEQKKGIQAKKVISTFRCNELPSAIESGYSFQSDDCVFFDKSETEKYVVSLISQILPRSNVPNRSADTAKDDIAVYKIYQITQNGKRSVYTEVYSEIFSRKRNMTKTSERTFDEYREENLPYHNTFYLLDNGSLVESVLTERANYLYTPILAGENSTLQDKIIFTTI